MNKVTGSNGFLLSHLNLDVHDCIVHFGSPSCLNEFSKASTDQMIEDTKELLKMPHNNIIFASSMGTEIPSDNLYQQMYNNAKCECERLIIESRKKYCILRIPRVYGPSRRKGLIQSLRKNEVLKEDYNKVIEYLDIQDFIEETQNININYNIIHYNNLRTNTIKEIKEIYIKE